MQTVEDTPTTIRICSKCGGSNFNLNAKKPRCKDCLTNRRVIAKNKGICQRCYKNPIISGKSTCNVCTNNMSKSSKKITFENKQKAVNLKGGKCYLCGMTEKKILGVYEFHHIDPSKKDFSVNRLTKKTSADGWNQTLAEIGKCLLLDRVCHTKLHYWLNNPQELPAKYRDKVVMYYPKLFTRTKYEKEQTSADSSNHSQ